MQIMKLVQKLKFMSIVNGIKQPCQLNLRRVFTLAHILQKNIPSILSLDKAQDSDLVPFLGDWSQKTIVIWHRFWEISWIFLQRQLLTTSKSSSKNLSYENKHCCFCFLSDKTWTKMPILWKNWDYLTNFLTW